MVIQTNQGLRDSWEIPPLSEKPSDRSGVDNESGELAQGINVLTRRRSISHRVWRACRTQGRRRAEREDVVGREEEEEEGRSALSTGGV